MLRVMAEKTVSAFNTEYRFPHLQVMADRNRVERDETYEIPAAARDRFLMEFNIDMPSEREFQRELMFNNRYHDVDTLIDSIPEGIVNYRELNGIAARIQSSISASPAMEDYALTLADATRAPQRHGVGIDGVDTENLVQAGMSPRGMSMLMRAARVEAWMAGRSSLLPVDLRRVFMPCVAHRIFLTPIYEMRRMTLMPTLIGEILDRVPAP